MADTLASDFDTITARNKDDMHYVMQSLGGGEFASKKMALSSVTGAVKMADMYTAGGNLGAKCALAIADLPSTGGTVNAESLQGAQSVTQDIFAGVTKPVTIIFAAGVVTFSVTQNVPAGSSLIGAGRGVSELKAASGLTSAFAIILGTDAVLSGLTIRGRNSGFAAHSGIAFKASSARCRIEDCEITEFDGDGIDTDATNTNGFILNCYVHNNLNEGIFIPQESNYHTVQGCHVYDNGFNGIDCNGTNPMILDNFVHGNGFSAFPTPAFPQDRCGIFLYPFGNGVNSQVRGNVVYANAAHGIVASIGFADTNSQFGSICHNTVFGNGTLGTGTGHGIFVDGDPTGENVSDTFIFGNLCYGNQGAGIAVAGAKALRTVVINNYCPQNNGGGFYNSGTDTCQWGNVDEFTAADSVFYSPVINTVNLGVGAFAATPSVYPLHVIGNFSSIAARFEPGLDQNCGIVLQAGNSATGREGFMDWYQNTVRAWSITKTSTGELAIVDVVGGPNLTMRYGTPNKMGFFGADPVAQPAVSGSRGANAALASLLTQLATLGIITDSTIV